MLADDAIIRQAAECLSSRSGSDTYMLAPEMSTYFRLNAMGTRIWELLEDSPTFERLCTQLTDEFDVSPEQCRVDASVYIDRLCEVGLATLEPR